MYYDLRMSFLKVELDVEVSTTRFYSFIYRNSCQYLHSHSVGKFFTDGLMDLCNHSIIVSQNLLKNKKTWLRLH
jgi:hypothetical protein